MSVDGKKKEKKKTLEENVAEKMNDHNVFMPQICD